MLLWDRAAGCCLANVMNGISCMNHFLPDLRVFEANDLETRARPADIHVHGRPPCKHYNFVFGRAVLAPKPANKEPKANPKVRTKAPASKPSGPKPPPAKRQKKE